MKKKERNAEKQEERQIHKERRNFTKTYKRHTYRTTNRKKKDIQIEKYTE